jgi:threonine/homoserine/homoserine lactone efflux protein
MLILFIKGFIIGFAIAAPVGPIGVLCIQRSLHNGFKIGLMTGLGAAFADGTYGLIAGFGLTALSSLLIQYQFWIRLIGGLFLLYLGIKLSLTPPREKSVGNSDRSLWHALGTTFLLTLTNPSTILSFIAVFAGLGLGTMHWDYLHAIALVLGITLGSAIWWLLLSGGVAFILHHRLSPTVMRRINRLSGVIILAFGIVSLSMK